MEKFSATEFYKIGLVLESIRGLLGYAGQPPMLPAPAGDAVDVYNARRAAFPIDDILKSSLVMMFETARNESEKIGLIHSFKSCKRTLEGLNDGLIKTQGDAVSEISHLHDLIISEMEEGLFLCVPSEKVRLYEQVEPFGVAVHTAFPSIKFDAQEAGNCLALGRGTACVFHLMRVLEIGLVTFAKLFPSVPTNKENWQQIIEKVESEIRAMPHLLAKPTDWKEKQEQYSQTANSFMFFKDAWRNYTAHARGKYTEDEADGIYRNTRAFMQSLTKLGIAE